MKKKSPPYAIIAAALLGIVAIVAGIQWKKGQDAAHEKELADLQTKMQQQVNDALATKTPTIVQTDTNVRNVYYATQPIEAGAKLSSAFYEKKLTPNDILPDAYSESPQNDMVGFYAIRTIEKGDPLTPRNIGKSLPYLSQRISPGMRAVALNIFNADANYTGGFAVDGDKVDLLFTTTAQDHLIKTQMLMQNVEILYIPGPKIESEQVNGITPAGPPGDPIAITFQVTPEQAQALIFLSQAKSDEGGHFSMILRAKSDKTELKLKSFDAVDYLGNYQKVQKITDRSILRVQELAAKIAAEEKLQASPGTTNETTNPTPPAP